MSPAKKKGQPRARRRRKLLRALVAFSLLTVLFLLGAWAWVESNSGRETIRGWIEGRGTDVLGRAVRIGSVDVDVLSFAVQLDQIQIEGGPESDELLLRADAIRLRVGPWALLSRRVLIRSLEIDGPIVHWDFPEGPEGLDLPDGGGGLDVTIDSLNVERGRIELNHQAWSIDSALSGLSLAFQPVAGLPGTPATRTGFLSIAGGDIAAGATPLGGGGVLALGAADLRFTVGDNLLRVDSARVGAGASELALTGSLTDWRDAAFAVDGTLAIEDLVTLMGVTAEGAFAGSAALTATGAFGAQPFRLDGGLRSPEVTIAGIRIADLSAEIDATRERLVVDSLRGSSFDGELDARIEADLTASPRVWSLQYVVRNVDLAALTDAPALRGFRFAGIGSGNGDFRWRSPAAETITGTGSVDVSLPAGTLESLVGPDPAGATERVGAADFEALENDDPPAQVGTGRQLAAPSLPLPIAARVDFELDAGTLLVHDATASLPGTEAAIEGTIGRDRSIAGTVRVESTDLRTLDRVFNQVRRFRGELPVPRPFGIAGSGSVNGTITGSLDDAELQGTLAARDLSVSGNPVGEVEGSLRLAGAALQVVDLRIVRNGGTASGDGRFRIGERGTGGDDFRFTLRLDGYPMEVSLPRVGVPLRVAGDTSGELSLSGAYGSSPAGEVRVRGDNVRLNDAGGLIGDVVLLLQPEQWVAERFELVGPRGRLLVSGAWNRTDDTVQARLDGFDVDASVATDVVPGDLELAGVLQVQALLTGTFDAPDAAATVRWTDAVANGVAIGAVASSAELRAGSLALAAIGRSDAGATAVPPPTPSVVGGGAAIPLPDVPATGWAASLSADLREPYNATLRAAGGPELAIAMLSAQGVEPGPDIDVRGTLQIEGSGPLGRWAAWTGQGVFDGLAFTGPDFGFSLPEPFALSLTDGVLDIELSRLVTDAGDLAAAASIDVAEGRWLAAEAAGTMSLAVLELLADGLHADGTIDVALQASGEVVGGEVAGTFVLRDIAIAHERSPWSAEGINGTVRLENDVLDLVDVRGATDGEPFSVDGRLPLSSLSGDRSAAPARLDLAVGNLPLAPLWQRTGALQQIVTGGRASVEISVEGYGTDWRQWTGRVDVPSVSLRLDDLGLSSDAAASLVLSGGRLEVDEAIALRGPGTALEVTGGFLLDPFRLDARLQGTANLDPFNAVTRGWGVAGRSSIDVRIVGQPPELAYDGIVTIASGLVNPPVLQPIENISATLRFDNRLVAIESFQGSLGGSRSINDANLFGDGEIQLVGSVPARFILNATVDAAEIRVQRGIRVVGSADLELEGTLERSLLSGSMLVSEAAYTTRWEGEEDLLALSDAGVGGVDNELARTVFLDLEVVAPGNVRIANNMANVELNADLQIRGTLAEPVLLGSTNVLDGTVTLRDQRYRFLRGSIEFQNPLRTEPTFDIGVETSIRQYLITVNLAGSDARGDLQADFTSSPPLSDLQLIQLLTTGDTPDETVPANQGVLGTVGTQATSFLTRQYLSHVERGAQRVFGIDRFRLDPAIVNGSGDPTARVTLGQQVTPDLWISWTTKLGATDEQLVQVEYQLTRGIRISATREDDGSIGVDVRFDHRLR